MSMARQEDAVSETMRKAYSYVRGHLKYLLSTCTPAQQDLFAKTYRNGIDAIPTASLDWACKQIENTLEKNHQTTQPNEE